MHAEYRNLTTGKITSVETEPLTNYNIIVLDQALKGRSSVSFTNTNVWRAGGSRNANVSGLDVNLFDQKNTYNFIWSGRFSSISGTDQYNGYKQVLGFAKIRGHWQYGLSTNLESENTIPMIWVICELPMNFQPMQNSDTMCLPPPKNS